MNTTTTKTQGAGRSQQQDQPSFSMDQLSLESIRQRVEAHVTANPVKAVGQAIAAGYILRFLPIRALLSTALRLAAPVMLLNQVIKRQGSDH